jgi:hypothetical protein
VTRFRRLLVILLGPLWVRTFRDPVRDGHLRLDRLSRTERQLARFGLVLLVLLLVSVLFSDVWRSGTLLQLYASHNDLNFLPRAVLPVTLLGFLLSWALLCWGAFDASPVVRVLVAVLFLSTTASLTVASAALGNGAWVLDHGGTLIRVGVLGVPATLVLSAVLHPWVRERPRAQAAVIAVLRVAALLALALLFGTLQWANVEAERQGLPPTIPGLVDGSIDQINIYLVPLVYVAAVTVIDFALDVSTSLTEPAQVLRRRWLLLILAGVLTFKILVQVVMEWDAWTATVTYQPVAFVRTVLCVVGLVALVAAVTRFAASEDYQLAKERSMYGSSFVLALPSVLSVFGVGIALFLLGQLHTDAGGKVNDQVPYSWLGGNGMALAGGVAVLIGLWLMRRSAGGFGDELGSAVVVVGAWCLVAFGLPWMGFHAGFSYPTVDLVVTVGVLLVLLLRWRSLSPAALAALTTLLVFSWLVMSRGDYISFIGGLVGLPAVLVIVFGVALTLASGSSFASESSKRLPAEARPLLFVGYLLLSVVILHWLEVTHEAGQDGFSLAGFYVIGIPMAFWLAARRILVRHEVPDSGQAATSLRGPTRTTPSTTSTS